MTELQSCAYLTLHDLCKRNTLFDSSVFFSFIDYNDGFNHVDSSRMASYEMFKSVGVKVPETARFETRQEMMKHVSMPCVVKFDTHVTLGTQTTVVKDNADYKHLFQMHNAFHVPGIVQKYIQGYEFTYTVLVGESNWVPVGLAQDYKKQFDGNVGLNTFGLGSVSPFDSPQVDDIVDKIVSCLMKDKFKGFLSCQFIVDDDIWLMECNTRLCDPEFQSMSASLGPEIYDRIVECVQGEVINSVVNSNTNAVTVSLINKQWPNPCERVALTFPENKFKIYQNPGVWDGGTYYGSITNSGDKSFAELAQEIYDFLEDLDLGPYRYRTDIGK